MKKLILILVFIPLFSIAQNADSKYYGEKINPENTVKLGGLINHAKENRGIKTNIKSNFFIFQMYEKTRF